jgi:outer membrane protein OmpA-like peptidoglycan-associated protein
MRPRELMMIVGAVGGLAVVGCQSPVVEASLPALPQGVSLYGPDRQRLDFSSWPAVRFADGAWEVGEAVRAQLDGMAGATRGAGRLLLVGVGDGEVPDEHSRQLGLARALAVRRALLDRGMDPARIHVTGLAASDAGGLTWGGVAGPRVECLVIRE